MSHIDTAEINRLARLARVGLTEDEAARMATELSAIVGFVEELQAVDVDATAPTDQVTGLEDVWRDDVVQASLGRDALLAGAPQVRDGYIVVRRVIGG